MAPALDFQWECWTRRSGTEGICAALIPTVSHHLAVKYFVFYWASFSSFEWWCCNLCNFHTYVVGLWGTAEEILPIWPFITRSECPVLVFDLHMFFSLNGENEKYPYPKCCHIQSWSSWISFLSIHYGGVYWLAGKMRRTELSECISQLYSFKVLFNLVGWIASRQCRVLTCGW